MSRAISVSYVFRSLRGLMDSMQLDLQMANARLYDEMQTQPHGSSPRRVSAPPRHAFFVPRFGVVGTRFLLGARFYFNTR